jgi:hypothetical protein
MCLCISRCGQPNLPATVGEASHMRVTSANEATQRNGNLTCGPHNAVAPEASKTTAQFRRRSQRTRHRWPMDPCRHTYHHWSRSIMEHDSSPRKPLVSIMELDELHWPCPARGRTCAKATRFISQPFPHTTPHCSYPPRLHQQGRGEATPSSFQLHQRNNHY